MLILDNDDKLIDIKEKIIYYMPNGEIKNIECLNLKNLENLNGKISKVYLNDGGVSIGYAEVNLKQNPNRIAFWLWSGLDMEPDDAKFEQLKQVYEYKAISEIIAVEVILYSNPRWGLKLTNKFSFHDALKICGKKIVEIEFDNNKIDVMSNYYVPFDIPKGNDEKRNSILYLKNKLRFASKRLSVSPNQVLFARYAGCNKTKCDLENLLFYNIGASVFANCSIQGIGFSEIPKDCCDNEKTYRYLYQVLNQEEIEKYFLGLSNIATWNDIALEYGENKPIRYFNALRNNAANIEMNNGLIRGNFALKIHLKLQRKVNVANYMKAVIDGIVCAFHYNENEESENSIISCISVKESYVRKGIWNPADDRLKLCLLTISYGDETPKFCGELYDLNNNC